MKRKTRYSLPAMRPIKANMPKDLSSSARVKAITVPVR
jgi:hypothetical protein